MAQLLVLPLYRVTDANGDPVPGALLYPSLTETTTPTPVYTTAALDTEHESPVEADGNGLLPAIYLDPDITYRFKAKTAAGADITGMDFDPVSVLSSGDISFTPAGTGAVSTTIQEIAGRTVRAFDFYTDAEKTACLAGADTSVATNLAKAITHAKTLIAPTFVLDSGTHYIGDNTITFDLPDYSTLVFEGEIKSAASAKDAVVIGSTGANKSGYSVRGVKIRRASNDTTAAPGAAGGSIGLRVVNLVDSSLDIRHVLKFSTGLLVIGAGVGCAYNTFSLGALVDSRTNLRLSQTGVAGYCNENLFLGGHLNHTIGYAAVSTTNLLIDHGATGPLALNNNVFVKLSLEDNADPAGTVIAATINGENNCLVHPRLENSADQAAYLIQFTVNSTECSVIGTPFGLGDSNISDLGARNVYTTSEGMLLSRGTAAAADRAVLKLRSTSDSTARLLQLLDATGDEAAYVTGEGHYHGTGYYDANGNLVLTTRGAAVADASGGATVDAEARTAINTLLARLRVHGTIAT